MITNIDDTNAILKFTLELGWLNRKSVIGKLKIYCHKNDLKLDYMEDKGLFESIYSIKVKGPYKHLNAIKQWIIDLEKDI